MLFLPTAPQVHQAGFIASSPFHDLNLGIASTGHQDLVAYPMGYGWERAGMQ